MADQADVRSLDRLEEFRQQAEAFRTGLLKEIESLTLELRRLTQWLEQDVLGYWGDESSKAERRWAECRDNLSRCQSYVRIDEKRPCTEEKKRLRLAEQLSVGGGGLPDNRVHVGKLRRLDRELLRDALRVVGEFQDHLRQRFRLEG